MTIKERNLKLVSLMYIIIPVIIFLFGWTRLYISIPTIAVSIFILIKNRKEEQANEKNINISKWGIILVGTLASLWCFLGGIGKVFYQPTFYRDYTIRNSIIRDLVLEPWPVMYNKSTYLSYYIGHWMLPSIIGKIFYCITDNADLSCSVGNMALYIWSVIGVILIFIWLIKILKADKVKKILIVLLLFIFFSGLDILGEYIRNGRFTDGRLITGFEWWNENVGQYSSLTSQMFWVYNQSIVPIIIMSMLYDESNARNKMFLLVYGLFFGPYAILGIALYFIVKDFIISPTTLKEYFCIQNILVILFIFPIIILYYICNYKVFYGEIISYNEFSFIDYLLFIIMEFLIYVILIFKNKDKVDLFVITGFLMIFPLINSQMDFVMRTSIPFILLLYIYVAKFIMDKSSNKIKKVILCILLAIASFNPLVEIRRGVYNTIKEGYIIVAEEINILELPEYFKNNYISTHNSIFYKYIGREGQYEKDI